MNKFKYILFSTMRIIGIWLLVSGLFYIPGMIYADNFISEKNTIRDLQLLLSINGFYNGPISSVIGPDTVIAINSYRDKRGLIPDGNLEYLREKLYNDAKEIVISNQLKLNRKNKKIKSIDNNKYTDFNKKLKDVDSDIEAIKDSLKNTNNTLYNINSGISTYFIDSFRDLVAIAITGLGVALGLIGGYITWRIPKLSNEIEKKVEQAHKDMIDTSYVTICYKIFVNLSNSSYLDYRELLDDINNKWFKITVDRAIWFSESAIQNANKITNNNERESMIEYAESHKTYHYASRGDTSDENRDFAITKAHHLKEMAEEFLGKKKTAEIDAGLQYLDTATWAFIRLGNGNEKEDGREMLEKLVAHPRTPNEVIENYKRIGELQSE